MVKQLSVLSYLLAFLFVFSPPGSAFGQDTIRLPDLNEKGKIGLSEAIFILQLVAGTRSYCQPSEETSLTPRANAEAEILAIEYGGQLVADQAVYERVLRDLASIRSTYPDVAGVQSRPAYNHSELLVALNVAGKSAFETGEYSDWDCLNQTYGVIDIRQFSGGFVLTFSGRFDIHLIASEYGSLASIESAEPNYYIGDGSDISLSSIDQGVHTYLFRKAWGDCPSGCINEELRIFTVDCAGNISVE